MKIKDYAEISEIFAYFQIGVAKREFLCYFWLCESILTNRPGCRGSTFSYNCIH